MKPLTISRTRYKKALERARQRGYESGHLLGCVKIYNRSQTTVRNAAAGGQRPDGKMAVRLHNTIVDAMMVFGEQVAQRVVDGVDRRQRAGKKKLKVKFNGRTFRPSRIVAKAQRRGQRD